MSPNTTQNRKLNIVNEKMVLCFGMCLAISLLLLFTSPTLCNDIFTTAEEVGTNLGAKIYSIICVIFPVVLIVDLALMFFTHNERKLQAEKAVAISACVIFVIIVLVYNASTNGGIDQWILNIFNSGSK